MMRLIKSKLQAGLGKAEGLGVVYAARPRLYFPRPSNKQHWYARVTPRFARLSCCEAREKRPVFWSVVPFLQALFPRFQLATFTLVGLFSGPRRLLSARSGRPFGLYREAMPPALRLFLRLAPEVLLVLQ